MSTLSLKSGILIQILFILAEWFTFYCWNDDWGILYKGVKAYPKVTILPLKLHFFVVTSVVYGAR
jgi:hypothetical protein